MDTVNRKCLQGQCKAEMKRLETLGARLSENVMGLRLQRERSKLIRILLVIKA